jgi:hypothetical protein
MARTTSVTLNPLAPEFTPSITKNDKAHGCTCDSRATVEKPATEEDHPSHEEGCTSDDCDEIDHVTGLILRDFSNHMFRLLFPTDQSEHSCVVCE